MYGVHCVDCDASKFLRRLDIGPRELHASWREAHKRQAFGLPVKRIKEFVWNATKWRKVVTDVQLGIEHVKKAHAASHKVASIVYPTIAALGETNEDIESAMLPALKRIMEESKTDAGVRMLCSSLKTDALASIFPPCETETLMTYWGASGDNVRESLTAKPPPMEGVELGDIQRAALDAAQAAFGAVVGKQRTMWQKRWLQRRKSAGFGSDSAMYEAVAWLRESVLWVLGQMWRHVKTFAFIAAMIAAVVLTYCAIMGRGYVDGGFAVDGKHEDGNVVNVAKPAYKGSSNFGFDIWGVGESMFNKAMGNGWATNKEVKEQQAAAQSQTNQANEKRRLRIQARDDAQKERIGKNETNQIGMNEDQKALDTAISLRRYETGVCSVVWQCMDAMVALVNRLSYTHWIARYIDAFFQKNVADVSAELLADNARKQYFLELLNEKNRSEEAKGLSEQLKSATNDVLKKVSVHGNNPAALSRWIGKKQGWWDYFTFSLSKTDFNAQESGLTTNEDVGSQLEVVSHIAAIRNAYKNEEISEDRSKKLLHTFLDPEKNKKNAEQAKTFFHKAFSKNEFDKYSVEIDNIVKGEFDEELKKASEAVKHAQTQAMGLSSYLSAIRNIPGLVSMGDALGVNGDHPAPSFQASQLIGTGLLTGIILAVYALGPMVLPVLLIAAGAGLLANYLTQSAHQAIVVAAGVLVVILPMMVNVTSDQYTQVQALTNLMLQTSGEIRTARIANAHAEAAAMHAKSVADAARAGAFASAAAGIAAGVATGGNPMAMSAAATAGGSLVSNMVAGEGALASTRLLAQTRTYFGEYV
jgi:hypothetical protein